LIWTEVSIYTTSEGVEILTATLMELNIAGIQIEDDEEMKAFLMANVNQGNYCDYIDDELLEKESGEVRVKFYLTKDSHGQELLQSVKNELEVLRGMELGTDLGRLAVETTEVLEEDWIENFKKHFKPLPVGKNIIIKPNWEEYRAKEGQVVFTIEPGHLFGTGLHQSTQLCIAEIEKYTTKGAKLLDLGCGTGILAIIGLLLGAGNAVAVDIEPKVIDIAHENARLNNVGNLVVYSGNLLRDEELKENLLKNRYDIVTVNIVADVIIGLLDFVKEALAEGGLIVASGIIDEREADVCNALQRHGFKIKSIQHKDNWVCVVGER